MSGLSTEYCPRAGSFLEVYAGNGDPYGNLGICDLLAAF